MSTELLYDTDVYECSFARSTLNESVTKALPSCLPEVEEVFPREPGFLCACDGHDDLHDYYGPPDDCFTSAQ